MSGSEVQRGTSPVILAFPHAGTAVPARIWEKLNENGRILADADWHTDMLYAGLLPAATTVRATFHRYVIDANRDPAGTSLYPGQNTTDLIPVADFDGKPIWRGGQEPTTADIAARLAEFHSPYHAALAAEIQQVLTRHGAAVLYDCHFIRSHIPFLFEDKLPDFNIGTGAPRTLPAAAREGCFEDLKRYDLPGTCCVAIESAAVEATRSAHGFTSILNSRFKGGWTTRHYGDPEGKNVHAIQMELAQSTSLATETPPFAYDPVKAKVIRRHLGRVLERVEAEAFNL